MGLPAPHTTVEEQYNYSGRASSLVSASYALAEKRYTTCGLAKKVRPSKIAKMGGNSESQLTKKLQSASALKVG